MNRGMVFAPTWWWTCNFCHLPFAICHLPSAICHLPFYFFISSITTCKLHPMKHLFYLVSALLPLCAHAAEFPELTLPAGVGVNIHFVTGHEQDLDKIAAGGFKFIRMDFGWSGIERQKGSYDWSSYDQLTGALEQRGLRPIYILDYSNSLYEEDQVSQDPISHKDQRETASPRHPESVAAFARWAAAAAKHYSGRHVIWEIWNEPNIAFWKPKPNVQEYTALALATAKAVRESDPSATIVGPASSEFPWQFLESFLASGILEQIDGVSVHPYRDIKKSPETATEDYQKLRSLIERFAPQSKKSMPILSGEWGYSTATNATPLETQAAFLVRQQLSNLLQGIPVSIWYDWKNDGPDPKDWEQNFGTVLPDLSPKPSYTAIQTMTRQLSGYRIVKRVETPNPKDFILLLSDAQGHSKLTAWTMDATHTATLDLTAFSAATASALNWKSEPLPLKADGKTIQLELSPLPVYLTLQP